MNEQSMLECCKRYSDKWPERPPVVCSKGWMYGIWCIGNDYRNHSAFYGSYPHGLLDRLSILLGDPNGKVLHLFSGSLPPGDYTRFDLVQKADVNGDAHALSTYFQPDTFNRIYADPPYTNEDADKYGTPMVNRNRVVAECSKIITKGGLLVWLDMVLPMYSKEVWTPIAHIGVVRSTNHRFRVVTIFERV